MCFRVTELDSFVEKLRQKGVTIVMGPGTMGETRFYYIADPSGVLLELMEPAEENYSAIGDPMAEL